MSASSIIASTCKVDFKDCGISAHFFECDDVNLFLRHLFAQVSHDMLQLSRGDYAISVLIKDLREVLRNQN